MFRSKVATIVFALSCMPAAFCQQMAPSGDQMALPTHQTKLQVLNSGSVKYWDKGYLVTYGTLDVQKGDPAVTLYGRDGTVAQKAFVWFDDADSLSIGDAAVSKSGQLIVAGGAMNKNGVVANFIARTDGTGQVKEVIRTTPFLPVHVCATDEDTVWAYGTDRDETGNGIPNSPMLRQYSFKGGQIRALIDRSNLDKSWLLLRGKYPEQVNLRCSSTTVTLFNGNSSEIITYDVEKDIVSRTTIDPLPPAIRITGFAATESGSTFISFHDRSSSPPQSGIFKLVPLGNNKAKWVPISNTVGRYLGGASAAQLIGADGENLVYTRQFDGLAFWSQVK